MREQNAAAVIIILAAVWIAIWGAWIPDANAALTQNAVDLAEWSTRLADVRDGPIAFAPDLLRLSVSLAITVLAIALAAVPQVWLRWLLRAAALIPAFVMLPPYPQVLQLWQAEGYTGRFVAAAAAFAGVAVCMLTDHLPEKTRAGVTAGVGVIAAATGVWAFRAMLPPFTAHYDRAVQPGWGLVLFAAGLLISAVLNGITIAKRGA